MGLFSRECGCLGKQMSGHGRGRRVVDIGSRRLERSDRINVARKICRSAGRQIEKQKRLCWRDSMTATTSKCCQLSPPNCRHASLCLSLFLLLSVCVWLTVLCYWKIWDFNGLYTWQWRNFDLYLCQLVFAAILWVKLSEKRFYRAMLCIRGTSHGPVSVSVSVSVCVCHKSEFY